MKSEIGYDKQETTMYLIEFSGNPSLLHPIDNEISEIKFIEKEKVLDILTHKDTKEFFMKYVVT